MIFQNKRKKSKNLLTIMMAVVLFFIRWGYHDFSLSAEEYTEDITAPTATIDLVSTDRQVTYDGKNVYDGNVDFTVQIGDEGKTSGICEIKVELKNHAGSIVATYTEDSSIWTSTDDIEDIINLRDNQNPTEQEIQDANNCVDSRGLTATLDGLEDGYYTLSARIQDKAGNVSEESEVCFIKDSKEPVIEFQKSNHEETDCVDEILSYNIGRTDESSYTGGSWIISISDMTLSTNEEDYIFSEQIVDEAASWSVFTDHETGLVTREITLGFGENELYKEGKYKFDVKAKDVFERESSRTSGNFTIDYTKPAYDVTFSEVSDFSDKTDEANTLYYNSDLIAKFVLQESTSYDEGLITIHVKKADGTEVIRWENGVATINNDTYRLKHDDSKVFELIIKADQENDDDGYQFEISGKDKAGNLLEAVNSEASKEVSKARVMDVTPPILDEIVYDTIDKFNRVGNRDYVNQATNMTFTITERHPMKNEYFMASITGSKNGLWTPGTDEDVYKTVIRVPMNGDQGDLQEISFMIMDKAGNRAVLGTGTTLRTADNTTFVSGKFTDQFTVDTVAPKIRFEYVAHHPDRPGVDGVDYFKRPITVKVTVDEHNFDESYFESLVEKTGSDVLIDETNGWISEGDIHEKTFTYTSDNQYDLSVKGTDHAKNPLSLTAMDQVSAKIDEMQSKVTLRTAVDTTLPAIGDSAKPVVVIKPSTATGTTTDGQALYNTDVTCEVVVYDPLLNNFASGIDHVRFHVKGEDGTTAEATVEKDGTVINGTGLVVEKSAFEKDNLAKGERNKYVFHVTIKSEIFNTNQIVLSATAEDVSTNKKEVSAKEIAIDTTPPKVEVSYDYNDVVNEKYFKETRIATIKVTERSFRDDCIQFFVNGGEQKLQFSLKSTGKGNRDDAIWEASYEFCADDDYTVEITCKDLAGNEGKIDYIGEAPQEFTIDKTPPKITVAYDNNIPRNEIYYKETRTATVIIEEHNFSSNDVEIMMKAENDGNNIDVPIISGWSEAGNLHTAMIPYNYDGEFTFDIAFTDLAGNVADDYIPDHFVIDLTAPELEIYDVENMSANNGKVRPGIRSYDTNFDADSALILMNGYHNGIVEITGVKRLEPNGLVLKLDDFAYEPEMDDLYTMEATVFDLAGNSSEEAVMFSVNRFGSVYTFDEVTDALIGENGKYYTNKAQELVITETNIDTLEFQEITCNFNGKLTTLKEGQDYSVTLEGNEATWKKYIYTVHADNFEEEGTYALTIYSQDRATNASDNQSKGKKIEFVLDKTSPSILISGVENHGQYRANSREMTLDIEDNVRLSQMKVSIDGEETFFEEAQIQEADGKFVMNIKHANHWQEIKVSVTDAAGNTEILQDLRVLVTENFLVQFYMNKRAFYGTIAGAVTVAAFVWWNLMKRKNFIKA